MRIDMLYAFFSMFTKVFFCYRHNSFFVFLCITILRQYYAAIGYYLCTKALISHNRYQAFRHCLYQRVALSFSYMPCREYEEMHLRHLFLYLIACKDSQICDFRIFSDFILIKVGGNSSGKI